MKTLSYLALAAIFSAVACLTSTAQFGSKPKLGVSLEVDGIVIDTVSEGSIAAEAGLHSGDYLTAWGSRLIAGIDDVLKAKDAAVAGTQSNFAVRRDGKIVNLKFRLPASFPDGGLILGVTVGSGVYVSKVHPGSVAADAGMKNGDIITEFGNDIVEDFDSLKHALSKARSGSSYVVKILRGGAVKVLTAKFPGMVMGGMLDTKKMPRPGQRRRNPFSMGGMKGMNFPGMGMFRDMMSIGPVKTDIDKSIAELEKLQNPSLAPIIARLRASSKRLDSIVRGMEGMRKMAGSFMGGLPPEIGAQAGSLRKLMGDLGVDELLDTDEPEEEPEPEIIEEMDHELPEDFAGIQERIQELLESGVTDADELNAAIRKEFPGVKVMINTGPPEEMESFEDFEDAPATPIKPTTKPTTKPVSKPKLQSKPTTKPTSKPMKRHNHKGGKGHGH